MFFVCYFIIYSCDTDEVNAFILYISENSQKKRLIIQNTD